MRKFILCSIVCSAVLVANDVAGEEGRTIEVTASKISNPGSTENSNSYTSNIVGIGKGNLQLKEIPQSISIITNQRLQDQNLYTLEQAMAQTPGVTTFPYGYGRDFFIRGFNVDAYQFDGVLAKEDQNVANSFDTVIFDHIEVLKGPSGLISGSGEPAGAINMVRKRALRHPKFQGALNGGSWNALRGELDITGPLDKEGNFRGRLIVAKDKRNSFIDEIFNNKSVFYGTLEYDFTPNTTLSVGGIFQNSHSRITDGLPVSARDGILLDLPRSTFLGDKWNNYDEKLARYFLDLEHHLSNGGEIRFTTSYLDAKQDIKDSASPRGYADLATGDIQLTSYRTKDNLQSFSIDTYATTPFELFNNRHNILLGVNFSNYKLSHPFWRYGYNTKNIFNPRHDLAEPDWANPAFSSIDTPKVMETGVYGQLRYKILDNLTFVGGSRLSWWENKNDHIKINAKLTPYAGLIYDISDKNSPNEYSLYVSYASIFVPQTQTAFDKKIIKPRTGNQYEIGVKASLLDGGLNASSSVFLIDDENRAIGDLDHPGFSVAQGKLRNYGFEAELSGNIMPWWDISAGYTFFDQKLIEKRDVNGSRAIVPRHSFKLWSSHNIGDFKVGYGAVVSGDMYAQLGEKRKMQDAYAVFSAMLGYRINRNFDLTFNINNIFDHKYYSRISGVQRQNHYGEPRNFMLTLRAKLD